MVLGKNIAGCKQTNITISFLSQYFYSSSLTVNRMKVDCDPNYNIHYVTRKFEKICFLYREKILRIPFA